MMQAGEQIGQEPMRFFERLKAAASAEWRVYTEHPFTNGMADGLLVEAAFRHYLVQDYLFLIEFARAYALAVYKAPKLADMREAAAGLSAILESAGALGAPCRFLFHARPRGRADCDLQGSHAARN